MNPTLCLRGTSVSVVKRRIHLIIHGWFPIHVAKHADDPFSLHVDILVYFCVIQVHAHLALRQFVSHATVGKSYLSHSAAVKSLGHVAMNVGQFCLVEVIVVRPPATLVHVNHAPGKANKSVHVGFKNNIAHVPLLFGIVTRFVGKSYHAAIISAKGYATLGCVVCVPLVKIALVPVEK